MKKKKTFFIQQFDTVHCCAGGGVSYDADAQAYFDAVPTPFNAARKEIINTLVLDLKASGDWSNLDRLWLLSNSAIGNSLISLVNPASPPMLNVGGMDWDIDEGFKSFNVPFAYLNTNTGLDSFTHYSQDSAMVYSYQRSVNTTTQTFGGVQDLGSVYGNYFSIDAGGTLTIHVNELYDFSVTLPGFGDTKAGLGYVRTAEFTVDCYRNGVIVGSPAAGQSFALVDKPMFIGGINSNGVLSSEDQEEQIYSVFAIGSKLVNQLTLHNSIQAYMTSLGFQN
jgi:hypothetical protein